MQFCNISTQENRVQENRVQENRVQENRSPGEQESRRTGVQENRSPGEQSQGRRSPILTSVLRVEATIGPGCPKTRLN